jgi:Raf kinase inhibitor-like YbhB/YbcL family protein
MIFKMKIKGLLGLLVIIFLLNTCSRNSNKDENNMVNAYLELIIECNSLQNGKIIPLKYTGRGDDVSPEFILKNLSSNGKTIAIIFDDMSHPIFGIFNHWIIWNIPIMDIIPGNIPDGKILPDLGNARQGIGYGRYKYRGPKPPKGTQHKYQFNFYVLDCEININNNSRKKHLLQAMEGHIIQYGYINGYFE